MVDYLNFETYLFISPKKFIIIVNTEKKEKIYEKELIFEKEIEEIDLETLDNFFTM